MGFAGLSDDACRRGEVDDPPTAALQQLIGRAVGQECATGIHRKDFFPLVQRDAVGTGIRRDTRSMYQHIQTIEPFVGPGESGIHGLAVSDIADSCMRPPATVPRHQGGFAQVEADDIGSLLHKCFDHCRADTPGASRDDDSFTGQLHGLSLWLSGGLIDALQRRSE